jgi:hypothetical protein
MSKTKKGVITMTNIEEFVGKTVDCKRGMFHHYPLTIMKTEEKYYYADRNGVAIHFNNKDSISFDSVREPMINIPDQKKRFGIIDRLEEIKNKGDGPDSASVPAGPIKPKAPER